MAPGKGKGKEQGEVEGPQLCFRKSQNKTFNPHNFDPKQAGANLKADSDSP